MLVETEWLDFGHKFADRCGHGENAEDLNERCPVFLQWLDCVHQLQRQFPCSFEFNEAFLVGKSRRKPFVSCTLIELFLELALNSFGFVCLGEACAAHILVSVRDVPV